jgi:hypothetical protein
MGDAAFIIPRMRLRPLSSPLLSRPYDCDDLPQNTYC